VSEPAAGGGFGQYSLLRKLGSGAMGEVWLAQPTDRAKGLPARLVIKRLHGHLRDDERALRRFLDEAELAKLLHHPNLIELYEVGTVDGEHFMAMEYVDGLHLRQCVEANQGPLPPVLAATIIAEACAGLAYAHNLTDDSGQPLHLVHRDIAPDNVMVDRSGCVKLVDFGIARTTNTDLTTKAGDRRGKIRYVSPEYLLGAEATPCSDVYSMGGTLFELCTGKRPFEEKKNIIEIAQAIRDRGLPRADLVNPAVPAELVATIASATQRDPARRLASANELERQLRRFLKKYAPPRPQQIGRDISKWKARLSPGSERDSAAATGAAPAARPAPKAPLKTRVQSSKKVAAPTKAAPTKPAPTKPAPTKPAPTKATDREEAATPSIIIDEQALALGAPARPTEKRQPEPAEELPSIVIAPELAADVVVIPPSPAKPRRR
jgi:serine/threonine protein kinase